MWPFFAPRPVIAGRPHGSSLVIDPVHRQAAYDINADDAIKFQVEFLRQKLGEKGHSDTIETIWTVGYKLHVEEEKS